MRSSNRAGTNNRPMYKTYLGNPPSITGAIYPGQHEKVAYKDPTPRISEGINRKLYESTGAQYFSPQLSPKGYSNIFAPNEEKRDRSQPAFEKSDRPGDFYNNKFKYDDYQPQAAFPNTPFKQNTQGDNSPQYLPGPYPPAPSQGAPYQNEPRMSHNSPQYRNFPNFSKPNPSEVMSRYESLTPHEPRNSAKVQYEEIEEQRKKRTVLPEILSPTYAGGLYRSQWPTVKDSAKMRNPLYSSYDFAEYQKHANLNNQHFRPENYNYANVEPVGQKEFLKSHATTFAQARNYDMEQKTKIHPQLGVLGVAEGERREEPILKPYAFENAQNGQNSPQQQYSATMRNQPVRQMPEQEGPSPTQMKGNNTSMYEQGYQEEQERQQQYQQQQQHNAQSQSMNYGRKTLENGRAQNKTIFAPNPQQGYLTGINRRPVMIMPPSSMNPNGADVRSVGPYQTNYKIPSTYPW